MCVEQTLVLGQLNVMQPPISRLPLCLTSGHAWSLPNPSKKPAHNRNFRPWPLGSPVLRRTMQTTYLRPPLSLHAHQWISAPSCKCLCMFLFGY
jgi:hypothetical protein